MREGQRTEMVEEKRLASREHEPACCATKQTSYSGLKLFVVSLLPTSCFLLPASAENKHRLSTISFQVAEGDESKRELNRQKEQGTQ